MKTPHVLFGLALVVSTFVIPTVTQASDNKYTTTFTNSTNTALQWNYINYAGSECTAEPDTGSINPDNKMVKSNVSCASTGDGEFFLQETASTETIAIIEAGYKSCYVKQVTSPYVVGFKFDGKTCSINITSTTQHNF